MHWPSIDLRRHFIAEGRNWNPYILMGLGYQREEIESDNFPDPDSPFEEEEGAVAGKFGLMNLPTPIAPNGALRVSRSLS